MIIYKTTNLINGKIYVGQHNTSSDDGYLGSGLILQKAIDKYGKENFKREILEFVNENNVDEREIYWIAYTSATQREIGYNITTGGYGVRGLFGEKNHFYGKKHTKEAKRKMSILKKGIKQSDEIVRKRVESRKGYIHSNETKKKMSEAHKGDKCYWYGKKQTKEMIKKRVKKIKEKVGKKIIIDGILYNSMKKAEEKLDISSKNIWYRIQSKNYKEYSYYI